MPGDFDDEFDGGETGDASEGGSTGETGPDPETVDGRRALLAQMIAVGGPMADMATDALEALDKREAEANVREAQLQAAAEVGPTGLAELVSVFESLRLDAEADPEEVRAAEQRVNAVKDALRAQVFAERAKADAIVIRQTEAYLRQKANVPADEPLPDYLQWEIDALKGRQGPDGKTQILGGQTQLAAFESGSDPLEDSPQWQAYRHDAWAAARERQAVIDFRNDRDNGLATWESERANAESANRAHVEKLAEEMGI